MAPRTTPPQRHEALRCALWLLIVGLGACAAPTPGAGGSGAPAARPESAPRPVVRAWPEADRLFRQDPRWLGGDAAVTVDLGGERILWLFGDSFIAPDATAEAPRRDRHGATMVRNSIAIQHGRDPSHARMRFVFPDGPASFFADEGPQWFWPQHGVLLEGQLTLFVYALAHDASDALGFRYRGWAALRVDNPQQPPEQWHLRRLRTPVTSPIEMVGAAVVAKGQHVYAYGVREPGDHALFVLRWTRPAFVAGDLSDPRVWAGPSRGWTRGPPVPVADQGQTEFSVVVEHDGARLVQAVGFGGASVAQRLAPALQGPFGPPLELHRPEEAGRRGVLIYAGRAHPALGGADLVLTYASNSLDGRALMDDLRLYFPRFLRVSY